MSIIFLTVVLVGICIRYGTLIENTGKFVQKHGMVATIIIHVFAIGWISIAISILIDATQPCS